MRSFRQYAKLIGDAIAGRVPEELQQHAQAHRDHDRRIANIEKKFGVEPEESKISVEIDEMAERFGK